MPNRRRLAFILILVPRCDIDLLLAQSLTFGLPPKVYFLRVQKTTVAPQSDLCTLSKDQLLACPKADLLPQH